MGVTSIVAKILRHDTSSPSSSHPTGMVVFYRDYKYDAEGTIAEDETLPPASVCAVVHSYCSEFEDEGEQLRERNKYSIAGVLLTDQMYDGSRIFSRATLRIAGSVAVCNTGRYPISAGDEVWCLMGTSDKAPPTVAGRDINESANDFVQLGYKFLGMCTLGAMPSVFNASDVKGSAPRLCFCQVMLAAF